MVKSVTHTSSAHCRRVFVRLIITMAKYIVQLIILSGRAVGRAFGQALRQEYKESVSARRAAEEAGRSGTNAAKASSLTGLGLGEAKQILNVKDLKDLEQIRHNYEHLLKVNAKSYGGSFYLQSKVVRAKERLEMELDREIAPTTQDTSADPSSKDKTPPGDGT